MNKHKLLRKLLSGQTNVRFEDARSLAEAVGFQLDRINGSHHIFKHPNIPKLLNLQNAKGQAKPYQIRQLVKFIEQYNLTIDGS